MLRGDANMDLYSMRGDCLFQNPANHVVVVRFSDLGAVEGAGDEFFVRAEVVDESVGKRVVP